jgi:glutamate racemase
MDKPIAFFDSGVGGLAYLETARRLLPSERFVYMADRAGFPYGTKNRLSVTECSVKAIRALVDRTAPKALVVACNTATELAIDEIRASVPGIPVIGTVPAIKTAAAMPDVARIGVIATPGAIAADYLTRLALEHAAHCTVVSVADGDLVGFVEHRFIGSTCDERLDAVRPGLGKLLGAGVDAIVLGCTHFLHLIDEFKNLAGPRVAIVDSRAGVAARLKHVLGSNLSTTETLDNKGNDEMYVTGPGDIGTVFMDFARLYSLVPMDCLQ